AGRVRDVRGAAGADLRLRALRRVGELRGHAGGPAGSGADAPGDDGPAGAGPGLPVRPPVGGGFAGVSDVVDRLRAAGCVFAEEEARLVGAAAAGARPRAGPLG